MAERIILPKQGLQMTEGTIIAWFVQEGGAVVQGQPLFEMETDKVTVSVDAEVSGVLLKILAGAGTVVPIAQTIAIVGRPGADISALLAAAVQSGGSGDGTAARAAVGTADSSVETSGAAGRPGAGTAEAVPGGRIFISPRAKTRAGELGIDYRNIRGSAPGGMIVERDILRAASGGAAASPSPASPLAKRIAEQAGLKLAEIRGTGVRGKIMRDDVIRAREAGGRRSLIPVKGMRKIIAERMKQSLSENAQAVHRISVRMDEALRVRLALEKAVGFNDLIALAAVRALLDFPLINAELTPGGIWQKDFVNLGVAVAVEGGLIVPVVKNADLLSLRELSAAIKELAERARNNALGPDDYTGGSFTISNLGMFGLEEFVAIINPPEAGILAVGKIEDTPVAVNGGVEIHPVMKLTLSYDHRIIDGAPAAQFLARIKEYLENPYKLL
ncbi:MAG: 2-oxo acid dehydrogenase subunit E2 [Treponema sp.]|jgi:pyruvate dehydrogenase E2 component (dihydrolipoamide acetyltransferase)|nr:2-oxo acid dehydrogenase subunit E2 [Treponema sp.]